MKKFDSNTRIELHVDKEQVKKNQRLHYILHNLIIK